MSIHIPAISVTNLTKTFNNGRRTFTALQEISFDLNQGEILGLLGPNGAGKTTTIQLLLSTLTPTSGAIQFFGKNFFTNRSEILQQLGFASTYVNLPAHLTVQENLKIQGLLYGMNGTALSEALELSLTAFKLEGLRNKEVGQLSAGQKTRVMLAKAFITKPKVVLLDEPTASLDPDVAEQIRSFILDLRAQHNISVLFTSHNMDEITTMCDRVIVLKHGSIIANAKPETLAASISTTRLQLVVGNGLEKTIALAQTNNLVYTLKDRWIEIALDERAIAHFLTQLALNDITYTHIAIEKPTLEDYFIHIAKHNQTGK